MRQQFKAIFALSISVIVLACNSQIDQNRNDGTAWGVGSFDSNGKRIYYAATSERNSAITYTGGPSTGMMMGGRLACVSCHGIDATGGKHTMHMETMDAPDIRWSALMGLPDEGHESGESKEHSHKGYDFETFRGAVTKGEHPDGDELKQDMPRWNMSDEDLHDLMDYLKSLQ